MTNDNVCSLLFASDFLRLRTGVVEEQCIKYLQKNDYLNFKPIAKVVEIFTFACATGKQPLVDIASSHMFLRSYHFSNDVELMKIPFESFNILVKRGKDCLLPIYGSENDLLKMIICWVNYSYSERGQYREELMKIVNSSNISSNYLLLFMNEMLKSVDAAMCTRTKTKSRKSLKKIKLDTEIELEDDTRRKATIKLLIKDMSDIKLYESEFSTPCTIRNLSWKIKIYRSELNKLEYYLYCENTHGCPSWKCHASVQLSIISQKDGVRNLCKNFDDIFSSEEFSWGYLEYADWNCITDPDYGYIKDDTAIFEAYVEADSPCLL